MNINEDEIIAARWALNKAHMNLIEAQEHIIRAGSPGRTKECIARELSGVRRLMDHLSTFLGDIGVREGD